MGAFAKVAGSAEPGAGACCPGPTGAGGPATRASQQADRTGVRTVIATSAVRDNGGDPRVHGEAVMEVRYGVEFAELNERFWSHFDTASSLVQALFGALALAGFFLATSTLSGVSGAILAIVSALQLTLRPRERSIQFRDARRALGGLNATAYDRTLQQLDNDLDRLRHEAPRGWDIFTRPAENRVLARHGFADRVRPLCWGERVVMAIT